MSEPRKRKTLDEIRDEFCTAIRREMANENYNFLPLNLSYLKNEYGIEPRFVWMLFSRWMPRRQRAKSLKRYLPEFELEYKPGWDDNLIIRRKATTDNKV